jgi:hypothetical protein
MEKKLILLKLLVYKQIYHFLSAGFKLGIVSEFLHSMKIFAKETHVGHVILCPSPGV